MKQVCGDDIYTLVGVKNIFVRETDDGDLVVLIWVELFTFPSSV